ncbi:MAG: ABC transporter permease, partial [Candidatus Krumholzibacteriia bacterium]
MPSPVREITLMRLRETLRQPEVVFWAFVFPVLLAAVLGLAFRERRPGPIPAVVAREPGREAAADSLAARLRREPRLRVEVLPPAEAAPPQRTAPPDHVHTPAHPR